VLSRSDTGHWSPWVLCAGAQRSQLTPLFLLFRLPGMFFEGSETSVGVLHMQRWLFSLLLTFHLICGGAFWMRA
jgi:hypothetical protein